MSLTTTLPASLGGAGNADAAGNAGASVPALTWSGGHFIRLGEPHRILSGSLHYFRVLPELWEDRLARLVALGLNTVDTYIAWNFHEARRGEVDFEGWRDLERFIGLAGAAGLDVILRPGPYICAEWDNGGLPAWLTGTPGLKPRSREAGYLAAVSEWFDELIPRLLPLQRSQGGPVVAFQVENEFGSFGDDIGYLEWMRRSLVERGVVELLYTADGPTELMLDGGTLPGVLTSATLGSGAADAAKLLRTRRTDEPFLVAEFWNGWFDHWGESHHVRSPDGVAQTVRDILAEPGGSVSFYMAHGGTNFGLFAGANHDGTRLQPTVTSYDSHAPIAENGALTPKFDAVRSVLGALHTETLPAAPPVAAVLPARVLPVVHGAALLPSLRGAGASVDAFHPQSFEELGQPNGLVLYRAHPILPHGESILSVRGLHDRAQVFVDNVLVGILDTVSGPAGLVVRGEGNAVQLELLVENQGRINYGPLLGQGKGILGGVQIDRRLVQGWTMVSLPVDEWSAGHLAEVALATTDVDGAAVGGAGWSTATLEVAEPADAFLALPGYAKGFVWVNGFLLGRHWEIGPQVTLYLPAPLLSVGANQITVLELERRGDHLELRDRPELGPPVEFIETF